MVQIRQGGGKDGLLMTTASFRHVLVRSPNWLGDAVFAQPAVEELERRFPKAKFTVVCVPRVADLWACRSKKHEIFVLERPGGRHGGLLGFWRAVREVRKLRCDAAWIFPFSFSSALLCAWAGIAHRVGFATESRSFLLTHPVPYRRPRSRHLVREYLDLIEEKNEKVLPRPRLELSKTFEKQARFFLQKQGILEKETAVALAPGANFGEAKAWPLNFYEQLAAWILEKTRCSVWVFGGESERERLASFGALWPGKWKKRLRNFAGETSLGVFLALLSRTRVLVANDSGALHAAEALGVPAVALFGSTSPVWTGPLGEKCIVVKHDVPCSPCFRKTCPIDTVCLKSISVEEVVFALRRLL